MRSSPTVLVGELSELFMAPKRCASLPLPPNVSDHGERAAVGSRELGSKLIVERTVASPPPPPSPQLDSSSSGRGVGGVGVLGGAGIGRLEAIVAVRCRGSWESARE